MKSDGTESESIVEDTKTLLDRQASIAKHGYKAAKNLLSGITQVVGAAVGVDIHGSSANTFILRNEHDAKIDRKSVV